MSFKLTKTDNLVVDALQDKKCRDITILDLTELSPITDKFIITTVDSGMQMRATVESLTRKMKEGGYKNPFKIDGLESLDGWVIVDYFDFMVHIFTEDKREYYNIENLWNLADSVEIENLDFIKDME